MMQRSTPRRQAASPARRGSAMLFVLVTILVFMIAGMGLAASTMQSLRLTRRQQESSLALNIAESGAERGMLWLRQQPAAPVGTGVLTLFGGPVTLGDGTYTVTLDPADDNGTAYLKRYTILSSGTVGGRTETVELFVQVATFGRYAYFTDYERSAVTNGGLWFRAGDSLDGPVHSNNTDNSQFQINYQGSTSPIFKSTLTSSASSIIYNPGAPTTEDQWRKIFEAGSQGLQSGVSRIELPDTTTEQKLAAWGDSTGLPGTPGLHVPADGDTTRGGLYIVGDAGVTFSVTAGGNQQVDVTQGGTTWRVEIDRNANTTTVTSGGTTTTYTGTTNGVIYGTGDITSLSGELADNSVSGSTITGKNAFTVATDLANGKNVTITGNLRYQTPPDKSLPPDDPTNLRAATLGVLARNIIVGDTAPADLTLHGVMMAGGRSSTDGSFYVKSWSSKGVGTLHLSGGIIQKKRGPVGTFDPSTGGMTSGYQKDYRYDERMAVDPPPFFPTTGKFERLSWRRLVPGS